MNPGSKEALAAGCQCPVKDNEFGREAPFPNNGWIVNLDCPVHGQAELPLEGDDDAGS